MKRSWTKASPRYGSSFPRMTATGEAGVTMSCSSVPRSRSRTMANAASRVPENVRRIATRPGIRRFAVRESGLKSMSGCTRIASSFTPAFSAISATDRDSASPLAAASAWLEIEESEPSISTSTSAGCPFRRRRP